MIGSVSLGQPARRRLCGGRLAGISLAVALAVGGQPVQAQQWSNPGTGDWFDASNWNPTVVPVTGAGAIISNGGTATLAGVAQTPLLGSLSVGSGAFGTGVGTLNSVGVEIRASAFNIGNILGGATLAHGVLDIAGAGAQGNAANVGVIVNATGAATATGKMTVAGALPLSAPFLQAGQIFASERGSSADGQLSIGGDAGFVGSGLIVGNVSSINDAQVGSQSTGQLSVLNGGNLTLNGGSNALVGAVSGSGSVLDGGNTFTDQATGTVVIDGVLRLAGGDANFVGVGNAGGGIADGALDVGALDMGGHRISTLQVGVSTTGRATGSLLSGSGDLAIAGTGRVGVTNSGTAVGSINLGTGQLVGNSTGALLVGTGSGSGGVASSTGTVTASGVSGFTSYTVGTLSGTVGAGSTAQGTVTGVGGLTSAQTGSLNVGFLLNTVNQASVGGSVTVDGPLQLTGGFLQIGQMFGSGRGSSAGGQAHISGDAGVVGSLLIVGNVTSLSDAQVGSQSTGQLSVLNGGDLTLGGTTVLVGTIAGSGSVLDGGNTFTDLAQGTVVIDGVLRLSGITSSMSIGRAGGGVADGAVRVGALDMGGKSIETLQVGVSTSGQATGSLNVGGGNLSAGTVLVGNTSSGSADGRIALTGVEMTATHVLAGTSTGGGTAMAHIVMNNSVATVQEDFSLLGGELLLDRSLLSVGDEFRMGGNADLLFALDGLNRGSEYGAIDTLLAYLDGRLAIDFSELAFGGGSMAFDLIRAGDSISGDFASFNFIGLDSQYQAQTGIFNVGDEQVYRLTLAQLNVPEPASLSLLLLALALMALGRRRLSVR